MDIKVELNATKVFSFLGAMPKKLEDALSRGLSKAVLIIESQSKQLAPVDTGRLRASIHTISRRLSAEVGTNTNYAVFVHEGTKFMRAQPFMREGLQKAESQIGEVIEGEISRALA